MVVLFNLKKSGKYAIPDMLSLLESTCKSDLYGSIEGGIQKFGSDLS